MLAKAEAGDKDYQRQLVEAGKEATAQVEHIVADQRSYAEVIENEARGYSQEELVALRTAEPYTMEIVDKITERIVTLTRKFLNCIPT